MEKLLSYLVYYCLVIPVSRLPFGLLYIFSDFLYLVVYFGIGYRKYVVRTNLRNSFPHYPLKEIIAIELKSVGGYAQTKGTVDGYPLNPKPQHLLQVGAYLDYFYAHPIFPIKEVWICYIARCTGRTNMFCVTLDEYRQILVDGKQQQIFTDMIRSRYEKLAEALNTHQLPERDYMLQYDKETLQALADKGELSKDAMAKLKKGKPVTKGDFQCSYCNFRTLCWTPEKIDDNDNLEGEIPI
jgi:hypothetical protein